MENIEKSCKIKKNKYTGAVLVELTGCNIMHKNFSGRPTKYNQAGGVPGFSVIIDDRIADKLSEIGVNVKVRPPKNDEDEPMYYFDLRMNRLDENPPTIFISDSDPDGIQMKEFNPKNIALLDRMEIVSTDMNLRVRYYDGGRVGVYVRQIEFVQEYDRFAAKAAAVQHPREEDDPDPDD